MGFSAGSSRLSARSDCCVEGEALVSTRLIGSRRSRGLMQTFRQRSIGVISEIISCGFIVKSAGQVKKGAVCKSKARQCEACLAMLDRASREMRRSRAAWWHSLELGQTTESG